MNLNDLPDEVLCTIFDNLDVYELKLASLVCRRWSDLTFSGRRMDRVMLVKRDCNCEFLFNTKRNYRNVRQPWVKDDQIESLVRLLHTIKSHVRMLDIQCDVTSGQLGSILLKVPELQHLHLPNRICQKYCKKNVPFRVLPELKRLNRRQIFSFFPTNVPNLQCLEMDCRTDLELEAWTYFSGQLKLVHVYDLRRRYLHPFFELSFPRLEDLVIRMFEFTFNEELDLERSNDFFRRHPFLRRLSLGKICSVKLIQIISHHCPELTHLYEVIVDFPEDGILESLVQLTKLKHLSLGGYVVRKLLRGPMKSLESVTLEVPFQVLLQNLFEVVPRLSCLRIIDSIFCDELQFICEKFSYLRSLGLKIVSVKFLSVADDSVRFDRLEHLQELKIWGNINIRSIHRNNVRRLKMCEGKIPNDELYQIPGKFPLLNRLTLLNGFSLVPVAAVKRLHKLMPSCRIDVHEKRFYPIDNVIAD